MRKFVCSNFEGTRKKVYNNRGGRNQFLNHCNDWDVVQELDSDGKVISDKWSDA